jgi:signal transduction histidine kinase
LQFEKALLLRDILSPAINSLNPMLKERGFDKTQIHLSDMSCVPPLSLDRLSFQQVAFNILANAIKYADSSTALRVVIAATTTRNACRISFRDWGIGIDDNDKDSLFTAGFRGVKAQSVDIRGAGLGLAIAKSIVDAHNGAISFSSLRSPTEVQITLPIRQPQIHSNLGDA